MDRQSAIATIIAQGEKEWDIIIIGGGATGLGIAVDAATRGYKTLCLEKFDFAKGTSSRSTKLVHGGVRYLAQGDLAMVMEALEERGLMYQNAPHLVHNQAFVIPTYAWWANSFYTMGLKLYDLMAGKLGLGPSQSISKEEVIKHIPGIKQEGLLGGVIYHDGQFDDARMAISLAQTATKNGATVINYADVIGFEKVGEKINGILLFDKVNHQELRARCKVVINATGIFSDEILALDNPMHHKLLRPSQGVHLVLDGEFLKGKSAIMIPQTDDGRVLFAVPWHQKLVLGTTDTSLDEISIEPRALANEVDFILKTAGQYLAKKPTKTDVFSVFAGLRPLTKPKDNETKTSEISRGYRIIVSDSGLISILGGKWTTYRKMAEKAVDMAILYAQLPPRNCITRQLPIHGYLKIESHDNHWHVYGSDIFQIQQIMRKHPELGDKLHERLPYTGAEVLWAIRNEMALKIEDVLARRLRALFLDAKASIEVAPIVASIMAKEFGWDETRLKQELDDFLNVAGGYVLN